jgi:hypothetical protein
MIKDRFANCPRCSDPAPIGDWQPGPGLDPHIRQFRCRRCKLTFYKLLSKEVIDDVRLQECKARAERL